MKRTFKKLAALFVTAYANRLYNQAVKVAETRHEMDGAIHYVITDPRNPKKLIIINIQQFLELRHRFEIRSKDMPIHELRNHCWYRTGKLINNTKKKGFDKDCLSAKKVEIRRLAFARELLSRAGLA